MLAAVGFAGLGLPAPEPAATAAVDLAEPFEDGTFFDDGAGFL